MHLYTDQNTVSPVDERLLIQKCLKNDRAAQKTLYETYAPVLYAVIRRYIRDEYIAEDLLIESFVKIYNKLNQFSGKGSFEGWLKRIAVNESLMYLRKHNVFHLTIESDNIVLPYKANIEENLDFEIVLQALDMLPVGYRTVFNMYVLEGYKHKEIAKELGISINTSKSQLRLAKERIRKILKKKQISITG